MVPMRIELRLSDEQEMRAFGAVVAEVARPSDVVILTGGLGSGKTTFVKGFVGAWDPAIEVTSPTFALCHQYPTHPPIAHIDCWRMQDRSELVDVALDELLDEGWVALIEWGERLGGLYDGLSLIIRLEVMGSARRAVVESETRRWESDFEALREACANIGEFQC